MVDAFYEKQAPKKQAYQEEMEEKLEALRKELRGYLEHNSEVEDIEKLGREEFVINERKEAALEEQTQHVCEEIRIKAEKDNL